MTTRKLVYEDETVRRYEVRDDDGNIVGTDEEPKQPPEGGGVACLLCGSPRL